MTDTLPETESGRLSWYRRLYHWCMSWADHPQATAVLFVMAFTEASFFPVPPDVLLIALCLGRPKRALWFAAVATVGSVAGALGGYAIGHTLFDTVGRPILEFYGLMTRYGVVQAMYQKYDVWAVGIAGLTPIPFKVFTVSAGAFDLQLPGFVAASAISRGLRFGAVALALRAWGDPARAFLDRHLEVLSVAFVALAVGGFLVIRFLL